jgi:O-phosphoseryl-tRNA(Cys) synthetase
MENKFSKMIEGCLKGVSEEDKKKMLTKFAAMCPCSVKDMSEEDTKAMKEKMMAFCGNKMEMMSACFKKAGSKPSCPSNTPAKA